MQDASGPSLVLGAVASPAIMDISEPVCVQGFKPWAEELEAMGASCRTTPEGRFRTTFILSSKHRNINRLRFAQAWAHTSSGGIIVMSGHKTDGVDAFLKEVKKHVDVAGSLPKSHGKVFWVQRSDIKVDVFEDWLSYSTPSQNADGYFTGAGMFSAANVDRGSSLLLEHLGSDLKGMVADLGAGWGLLTSRLLAQNNAVDQADLFEADFSSIEAAKLNVTDERARFYWEDVVNLTGFERRYDVVVSNPPFHQTRKTEPELGQSFIRKAAQLLKPAGRLLMVANRQLPYERVLDHHFRFFENLGEAHGYKIIMARNPRPVKR